MVRYLFSVSGTIIGYVDDNQRSLYDKAGNIIAHFDDKCKLLYRPDQSVYGYVSGAARRDLVNEAGERIGFFQPSLAKY
jgi:hypothetical protein